MRAGVPIIPIALMGTEDTTPVVGRLEVAGYRYPITLNALLFGPVLGALAHFPAKIRARALPPIHFDEPPDQATYSRSRLMDSAEDIRGRLQHALETAENCKWQDDASIVGVLQITTKEVSNTTS